MRPEYFYTSLAFNNISRLSSIGLINCALNVPLEKIDTSYVCALSPYNRWKTSLARERESSTRYGAFSFV